MCQNVDPIDHIRRRLPYAEHPARLLTAHLLEAAQPEKGFGTVRCVRQSQGTDRLSVAHSDKCGFL